MRFYYTIICNLGDLIKNYNVRLKYLKQNYTFENDGNFEDFFLSCGFLKFTSWLEKY